MTPGLELDALVAEKVMGWGRPRPEWVASTPDSPWVNPKDGLGYRPSEIALYSTDIAAAWEVVEKWKDGVQIFKAGDHYTCALTVKRVPNHFQVISESAPTAPHAICLAALKAVGVEVPE